jgi:hypothetical protein
MTCPTFSDRDQALRDQMAEAQQKLNADMRRETDPRWHLLPVEAVKPPRRHLWLLAIPAVGLCLIVLATAGVLS